jgi:hypothetical protein
MQEATQGWGGPGQPTSPPRQVEPRTPCHEAPPNRPLGRVNDPETAVMHAHHPFPADPSVMRAGDKSPTRGPSRRLRKPSLPSYAYTACRDTGFSSGAATDDHSPDQQDTDIRETSDTDH